MIKPNQIIIPAIAGIDGTRSDMIKKHIANYLTKYLTDCLTPIETPKVSVSVNITIKNR